MSGSGEATEPLTESRLGHISLDAAVIQARPLAKQDAPKCLDGLQLQFRPPSGSLLEDRTGEEEHNFNLMGRIVVPQVHTRPEADITVTAPMPISASPQSDGASPNRPTALSLTETSISEPEKTTSSAWDAAGPRPVLRPGAQPQRQKTNKLYWLAPRVIAVLVLAGFALGCANNQGAAPADDSQGYVKEGSSSK